MCVCAFEGICVLLLVRLRDLERFPMNRPLAVLVELALRDPHLLEGVERCENRTAHPGRVDALLRGGDLK